MSETPRFKRWEELDITDDFIFTRVMRNKRLCRTLLEMILKVKIGRIKFLTSHHSLQIDPNAKGIIMDVYLRDENKVINVEMQTANHGDLAQRARYYQAAADIDTTPKGSEYSDLKQNYVIFICCFDPFNRGRPIYRFQNICLDDEHKTDPDSMRIIMDVFLRDENRIITVEMQTGRKKELPKRSRYYQSVADVSTTPTGAKYRNLPDNILIFICTFDPFNKDLPRYTFQYTCNEDPELKLKDGSLRIFLNATATELSDLDQKLQAFYHYLQEGVVESELARTISESITTLKNNSLERRHYMTWTVKMADARYDGYDEGYEKGISIGLERGRATGREEGAYQNKLETARKLIVRGNSTEDVADLTGLSLLQIKELMADIEAI